MTLASTSLVAETPAYQLVLFRLETRVYGIDLELVREIIPFRPATRLPGAPSHVCGLINLRGTIITVIDMQARLNGGGSRRAGGSVILVEYGPKLVGLAVDEALEVQQLAEADVDPTSTEEAAGAVVRAVGRLPDTVVILLDAREIVRQILL